MTGVASRYAEIIRQMTSDLKVFEQKYQGRFLEPPHVGLGNRKTRCVNEATLPIITCHPSCLEKCAGTCYVLRICTILRPNCRRCEARNTVLRRIDPKSYYEHFYREYQKSLAKFSLRNREIAVELRHQGVDAKEASRRADRQAERECPVWHCRNCAQQGVGCCRRGDIRFNVVGAVDWAVRAENAAHSPNR